MAEETRCPCCGSARLGPAPLSLEDFFSCRGCGLVFASRKRREEMLRDVAGHYAGDDPHDRVAEHKAGFFAQALDRLGPPAPGARLLDVGCGFGYFLSLAAERGFAAHGVDIVEGACRKAAKRPGVAGVFCGELSTAGFEGKSFDVVTLWDSLMVSPDPAAAVREVKRILKPGGTVGIRDRNAAFQMALRLAYRGLGAPARRLGVRDPSVFHPYTFGSASLAALLGRSGFVEVRVMNSPLTTSDPYAVSRLPGAARAAKAAAGLLARGVYAASGGRWVAGPSLLAWGRKP